MSEAITEPSDSIAPSKSAGRADGEMALMSVWRLMTSYGLVVIILLLLTLLTLLGTLEQKDQGLFDTQKKYFESIFVIHWIEIGRVSLPIPLPGAYLLMMVLFFNLLAGAIIKARKSWDRPGMLIAHSGILLLLVGGFVSHHYSTKGYMALGKGQQSDQFMAYQGWQLEVLPLDEENRPSAAFVITEEQLKSVGGRGRRTFSSGEIPFEIEVRGYLRNSAPAPISAPITAKSDAPEIDGFKLLEQDLEKEAEANVGGAYVTVKCSDGEDFEGILWAGQAAPWVIDIDDKKWALTLDRPRWDVPFDVRLDEFIFDRHPGTSMAKKFESRITKIESGIETPVQIRMNEPLRDRGYTFFQESYGPPDESDADKMWSQFSVVRNPADQWPLYSLIVCGVGLLIHFVQKLWIFVRRSQRNRKTNSGATA